MSKSIQKRAVLFLDILGFREIVEECISKPDKIEDIYEALSLLKEHFSTFEDNSKFRVIKEFFFHQISHC